MYIFSVYRNLNRLYINICLYQKPCQVEKYHGVCWLHCPTYPSSWCMMGQRPLDTFSNLRRLMTGDRGLRTLTPASSYFQVCSWVPRYVWIPGGSKTLVLINHIGLLLYQDSYKNIFTIFYKEKKKWIELKENRWPKGVAWGMTDKIQILSLHQQD